jgi:serine/threonine protein kinase
VDRLQVANDIASMLSYLRILNLIFSYLKLSYIGFDFEGRIKIFDFGLCRELPTNREGMDSVHQLAGNVGISQYMAPEVVLNQNYNQKADVYSLAMVMYEILSLNQTSSTSQKASGYNGALETDLESYLCWPPIIHETLHRAWSHDIARRPTMKKIFHMVRMQIAKLKGNGATTGESCDVGTQRTKKPVDDFDNSTVGTIRTLSLGPISQSKTS